uniref:Phosphatidic acid phosphatase type 2/haloperoxidase domain-containing protein n=1 Tax=viral metagenome TaxID=1070528 RepID=A0A6C0EM81_9ZZZZ
MGFGNELSGIAASMPMIIGGGSLLAGLVGNSKLAIYFTLGVFLQDKILNTFILKKLIFGNMKGNWKYRPSNIPCEGCGLFADCSLCGKDKLAVKRHIGMPSGHSQTMCFSATFWTMYMLKKHSKSGIIIAIWLLALIIMIDRMRRNCHTMFQVTVGAVIGVALGYSYWLLVEKELLNGNISATLY